MLNSEDRVREALSACNDEVHAAAARDPALTTMGTTAAGVVVTADLVLAFNVGDSRVYAVGPGGVRQPSTDDRLAGDELPAGLVTHALGGSDELTAVYPHLVTSPLSEDTSYLICTDGLTDPVPAGVLNEVLREHDDGRAVFELWKAAVEAGGPDNITIALVRAAPGLPPCSSPSRPDAGRSLSPAHRHVRQISTTRGPGRQDDLLGLG
jgi:serine/threonine protein phosphatase PrpC